MELLLLDALLNKGVHKALHAGRVLDGMVELLRQMHRGPLKFGWHENDRGNGVGQYFAGVIDIAAAYGSLASAAAAAG